MWRKNKMEMIINVHSVIDVITNSSTELYIVDRSKIKESLQEVFDVITKSVGGNSYHETKIMSLKEYCKSYGYKIYFKNKIDESDLYVFNVDYSEITLNSLVRDLFNPIPHSEYRYDDEEDEFED